LVYEIGAHLISRERKHRKTWWRPLVATLPPSSRFRGLGERQLLDHNLDRHHTKLLENKDVPEQRCAATWSTALRANVDLHPSWRRLALQRPPLAPARRPRPRAARQQLAFDSRGPLRFTALLRRTQGARPLHRADHGGTSSSPPIGGAVTLKPRAIGRPLGSSVGCDASAAPPAPHISC